MMQGYENMRKDPVAFITWFYADRAAGIAEMRAAIAIMARIDAHKKTEPKIKVMELSRNAYKVQGVHFDEIIHDEACFMAPITPEPKPDKALPFLTTNKLGEGAHE